MLGLVTRDPDDLPADGADVTFFEVKGVTGRRATPRADAVNMVSCHGDTAASADPERVARDDEGRPATRDRRYFDWGYVCPTHEGYREELVSIVERCGEVAEDVRLDDVGFPRGEYCRCDRCDRAFAASPQSDRRAWRADVITAVVVAAADVIPGRVYLTVYPDPYRGHLYHRSGLDLAAIEPLVDRFVIPLYDTAYGTTYWLEALASGFADRLDTPIGIELYAVEVELDRLIHAAEVARAYADDVYFAYDADVGLEAIARLRDDAGVD